MQLNTSEPHIHVIAMGSVICDVSYRKMPGNSAIPDASSENDRSIANMILGLRYSVTYLDNESF